MKDGPLLLSANLPVPVRRPPFPGRAPPPPAAGLCKLDLQLVSQQVESVWLSGLYPVNSMRNRALAAAKTDVVLLLDVDFWPAAELSELVHKPGKYTSLLAAVAAGHAIVLPAFETGESGDVGVEVAREAVLEGKDTAVAMFWDGRIKPFHTDRYRAGHRATDYRKWLVASRPYLIRYEEVGAASGWCRDGLAAFVAGSQLRAALQRSPAPVPCCPHTQLPTPSTPTYIHCDPVVAGCVGLLSPDVARLPDVPRVPTPPTCHPPAATPTLCPSAGL